MLAQSGTEFARVEVLPEALEDESIPTFDDLYRHNFRFTWSVLRRLGVPESSIEDAAQEVWVIVHRRLDALESPRAVRSWLFQIARRVAARHRRGEQRSQRKLDAWSFIAPRRDQPHAERDSVLTVETLLGQIEQRKREAFVLSELEGWSAPEIAKAAGTNPNTVYSRIRLARAELRAGWDARRTDVALEDALTEMKSRTRPPRGTAKRCWVLLAPKLAVGTTAATTAASAGSTAGALAGWKLYVAGTLALGLAAAGGSVIEDRRAAAGTGSPTAAVTESVASAPSTARPSTREPASAAAPANDESIEAEPAPETEAAPEPEPELIPAVTDDSTSHARPNRRPSSSATPAPSESPSGSGPGLSDETSLLGAAQTSLAQGRPAQALTQLAEHRTRFSGSALVDLRTLLELKALCATNKTAQARGVLAQAESTMAGSALLAKMRNTCAGQEPADAE